MRFPRAGLHVELGEHDVEVIGELLDGIELARRPRIDDRVEIGRLRDLRHAQHRRHITGR